jgi:putative addiction module component (TIGR02574 family)
MAMTRKQILSEAMSLPSKDRELLAEQLWFSVDSRTQEQNWNAWAKEIRKRLRDLDQGDVETIAGEQVMAAARKLVRKKRTA